MEDYDNPSQRSIMDREITKRLAWVNLLKEVRDAGHQSSPEIITLHKGV
jgi:hypothetical protein